MGQSHYQKIAEIAAHWAVHRTTVVRTMERYGVGGIKLGPAKKSNRRFLAVDVKRVETLAGYNNDTIHE